MHRYEENNRLLNSFYAPDPNEQEREALRSELDNLKKELASKNENEDAEEKRQLALNNNVEVFRFVVTRLHPLYQI